MQIRLLEIQYYNQMIINKIIKKKIKRIQNYIVARVNLFITLIVKHKKLMQFMVHNKLFRIAEFACKLGYSVYKRIK